MCGRFYLSQVTERIAEQFGAQALPAPVDSSPHNPTCPRFNIAPSQPVLLVRASHEGNRREMALARWGLVPSWAPDVSIGSRMINARSETAPDKPAFRSAMRRRRCLIPADGFYEWRRSGKTKRPMLIRRADGVALAMGGLWERWRNPETGNTIETCAILTCEPNALMAPIHDRMPVILEAESWTSWLDPSVTDATGLAPLLRPAGEGVLMAYPVSSRVNSPGNDDPGLIDPVEDVPDSLFGAD